MFRAGRYAEIVVSGVNLSAFCDSLDFSSETEMLDTTTFTATSKTYITGLRDTKVDIKGKYDPTVTSGPAAVLTSLLGNATTVPIQFFPGGNSVGQLKRYGDAYVVSYKESAAVGDVVAFESGLQFSGQILASGI
jgi:hypothetical protein